MLPWFLDDDALEDARALIRSAGHSFAPASGGRTSCRHCGWVVDANVDLNPTHVPQCPGRT